MPTTLQLIPTQPRIFTHSYGPVLKHQQFHETQIFCFTDFRNKRALAHVRLTSVNDSPRRALKVIMTQV